MEEVARRVRGGSEMDEMYRRAPECVPNTPGGVSDTPAARRVPRGGRMRERGPRSGPGRVGARVSGERARGRERALAGGALVRFLARVRPDVRGERARLREGLAAGGAAKGFLPRVNPHVRREVARALKHLAARLARVLTPGRSGLRNPSVFWKMKCDDGRLRRRC